MGPLKLLLAALALLVGTGCSTAGRIMGLAVAEDIARIGGALTNQEVSATRLADNLAIAREALEQKERTDLELARKSEENAKKIAALEAERLAEAEAKKNGWSTETKVTVGTLIAAALAKALDAMQGAERDRRHRDRAERELQAAPPRRRRRTAAVDDDDEPELEDPPPRRGRLAPAPG